MASLLDDMRRKADEPALEADKKLRISRKQGEINVTNSNNKSPLSARRPITCTRRDARSRPNWTIYVRPSMTSIKPSPRSRPRLKPSSKKRFLPPPPTSPVPDVITPSLATRLSVCIVVCLAPGLRLHRRCKHAATAEMPFPPTPDFALIAAALFFP